MAVSTVERSTTAPAGENRGARATPLNNGDRLTRVEFERIYAAHPEIKKAELIEGVVYMPSPTRYREHGKPHFHAIGWLGVCTKLLRPALEGGDNATLRLDLRE